MNGRLQILFCQFLLLSHCGHPPPSGDGTNIQFGVKFPYTASGTNEIYVNGPDSLKITLENIGEPFSSSVPFQELVSAPEQITLNFRKKTKYNALISIFADDGALLAKDKIQWIHDDIIPPKPIVSFSENATNDPNVLLLFASNRGPLTNQVWISGDLGGKFPPEGAFYDLPLDGRLPIVVSEGQGWKELHIHLRNEFGKESEPVSIKIFHKTSKPDACDALIAASVVSQNVARIKLIGNDSESVFFGVQGDTADYTSFKQFVSGEIHDVALSAGHGEKKITVLMRDEAENYCLRKNFQLTVAKNTAESWLTIKNDLAFTDQRKIELNLKVNDFADSPLEMRLFGHVIETEKHWQPFDPNITATLTEGGGEKVIEAFVRPIGAQKIRYRSSTRILMSPRVYRRNTAQGIFLIFNEFSRISGIAIKGCLDQSSRLKPQSNLLCIPTGEDISITYFFDNNTQTEIKI
jgi:hypothetical protein